MMNNYAYVKTTGVDFICYAFMTAFGNPSSLTAKQFKVFAEAQEASVVDAPFCNTTSFLSGYCADVSQGAGPGGIGTFQFFAGAYDEKGISIADPLLKAFTDKECGPSVAGVGIVAGMAALFFCACAIGIAYAFYQSRKLQDTPKQPGEDSRLVDSTDVEQGDALSPKILAGR